ncbi:hypothetical protein, partial [Aeromonas allosaccharophila]|uniref:hypothetical protein n=1 Tax=Aeromonas allosaccharophila TaxID=656 RepID=UPI001E46CAB6
MSGYLWNQKTAASNKKFRGQEIKQFKYQPTCRITGNKKPRSMSGVSWIGCLAVSYSRMANATLPSALPRFTSEL